MAWRAEERPGRTHPARSDTGGRAVSSPSSRPWKWWRSSPAARPSTCRRRAPGPSRPMPTGLWPGAAACPGHLVAALASPEVGLAIHRHGGRPFVALAALLLAAGHVMPGAEPSGVRSAWMSSTSKPMSLACPWCGGAGRRPRGERCPGRPARHAPRRRPKRRQASTAWPPRESTPSFVRPATDTGPRAAS